MATESLAPDVLLQQDNLSGALVDIDEDPDSPDANWLTYIANNVDTVCRVSFPTPTGNPTQGADLQEFKIWVRQQPDGAGADPTVRIELYENGSSLATILADIAVSSTTGALYSGAWDANLLGTSDGSLVECYIYGSAVGGAPGNRCTVEVGAVEWNVTYTTEVIEWLAGESNGVATVAGVVTRNRKVTGQSAGIAGVSGAVKVGKKLSGLSTGQATTSGAVKIARKLAGVSAGICQVTGLVKVAKKVAGISAGIATVTGNLTVVSEAIQWLSGISSGAAQVTGNLSRVRKLAAISSGIASVTGSVSIMKGLSGISIGISTVSGSIAVVGIRYLSGISRGVTTITAPLRKKLVAPPGREIKAYDHVPGNLWV